MKLAYNQAEHLVLQGKTQEAISALAVALREQNDDRAIRPLSNLGINGLSVLGMAAIEGNKKALQALEVEAAKKGDTAIPAKIALKHVQEIMNQRGAA